jgi:hypothetical protein
MFDAAGAVYAMGGAELIELALAVVWLAVRDLLIVPKIFLLVVCLVRYFGVFEERLVACYGRRIRQKPADGYVAVDSGALVRVRREWDVRLTYLGPLLFCFRLFVVKVLFFTINRLC